MLSSLRIETFNLISWKGGTPEVYVVWKQSLPVYHYHHCRHHHRRHNRYSHNRKNFCQTWTVQGGYFEVQVLKIKTGSYIFHKRRLRFLNGSYVTFSGVTVQYCMYFCLSLLYLLITTIVTIIVATIIMHYDFTSSYIIVIIIITIITVQADQFSCDPTRDLLKNRMTRTWWFTIMYM